MKPEAQTQARIELMQVASPTHIGLVGRQNALSCPSNTRIGHLQQLHKMQLLAVLRNVSFIDPEHTIRPCAPEGLAEKFADLYLKELADRWTSLSEAKQSAFLEEKIGQWKTYAAQVLIIIES